MSYPPSTFSPDMVVVLSPGVRVEVCGLPSVLGLNGHTGVIERQEFNHHFVVRLDDGKKTSLHGRHLAILDFSQMPRVKEGAVSTRKLSQTGKKLPARFEAIPEE